MLRPMYTELDNAHGPRGSLIIGRHDDRRYILERDPKCPLGLRLKLFRAAKLRLH